MKTKEELNALKEEVEAINKKLCELTKEELEEVIGGFAHYDYTGCYKTKVACDFIEIDPQQIAHGVDGEGIDINRIPQILPEIHQIGKESKDHPLHNPAHKR